MRNIHEITFNTVNYLHICKHNNFMSASFPDCDISSHKLNIEKKFKEKRGWIY